MIFPYTEAVHTEWIEGMGEDAGNQPIPVAGFNRDDFNKNAKFSDEHDLKVVFTRPLTTGPFEVTFHSDNGFTFLHFLDMIRVQFHEFYDHLDQYSLAEHSINDYVLECIDMREDGKYVLRFGS
jgi:hypothetical protein